MDKYRIITIISDNSLVEFQKKVAEFTANKKIVRKIIGVSAIPIPTNKGIGITLLPYAYIDHDCTEQEWKEWKFNQSIMQP